MSLGIPSLWRMAGEPVAPVESYRVTRGDLVISVLESGSLKALESKEIRSEVEGKTTIIRIVPEGTLITEADVQAGKVLIELDSSALRDSATQQEIQVNNSRSALDQARENLVIELKQNESDIQAGELAVKFARMDIEKYLGDKLARSVLSGDDPLPALDRVGDVLGGEARQKLRNFESDIDLAKEEVSRSQNKLSWTRKLYDGGHVTRDELQADELSLKRNMIELERAQTELDLYMRYDFVKESEKRISDYLEATRELERLIAKARSKAAKARADVASKQLNHELQSKKFQKLKDQIDKCTIRASRPGLVVYATGGSRWRRQEPIEEGAAVRERQSLLRLPDLSVMAVEVKVIESAVKKVSPGQRVIIKPDAFPDLTLTGQVQRVSAVPDSQVGWLNPDLKVYTTEVIIDGRHPNLKPGMSVQVEIIAGTLTDVLQVPVQAIQQKGDRPVCYVIRGRHLEARPVVVGGSNDNFAHILKGIAAGERVLLRKPLPEERVETAGEVEKPSATAETDGSHRTESTG